MSRIKIETLTATRNLTADEMQKIIGGSGSTDNSLEGANHDLFESHTGDSRKKKKKHGKEAHPR